MKVKKIVPKIVPKEVCITYEITLTKDEKCLLQTVSFYNQSVSHLVTKKCGASFDYEVILGEFLYQLNICLERGMEN